MTAPGVAEVIFKYKDDALEAYRKYNQRNLDGQPMICRVHPAARGRTAAATGGSYGSRYVRWLAQPFGDSNPPPPNRLPLSEPYGSDLYSHPHHSGYY